MITSLGALAKIRIFLDLLALEYFAATTTNSFTVKLPLPPAIQSVGFYPDKRRMLGFLPVM